MTGAPATDDSSTGPSAGERGRRTTGTSPGGGAGRGNRRTGRRPGNPDTRETILAAARDAFAEKGFSGASIRRIAADADVDPALVHHYFGTKRQLFLATVRIPVDPAAIVERVLADGVDGLGTRIITAMLGAWESPAGPALQAAVRTAIAEPSTTSMLQQFISSELISVLRRLDYPRHEADLRAALASSQMVGVIAGRFILGIEPLASTGTEQLIAGIGPVLQHYLTGDLGGAVR